MGILGAARRQAVVVLVSLALGLHLGAWRAASDDLVDLLATAPRTPGTAGHGRAQELLLDSLAASGLTEVGRSRVTGEVPWVHLTGVLPGLGVHEVVLSAHYDTTAGNVGRLDNASGCAVVLAAAESLAQVPRQHTLRLLFTDGEESQAAGSRAWVEALAPTTRAGVLAALNVDMVGASGSRDSPGVLHLVSARVGARRTLSPAWLVHAVLRAAERSELRIAVLDPHWSWFAQLAVRGARPVRVSDGGSFVAGGVPAVTLSDGALTARPTASTAAGDAEVSLDGRRLEAWEGLVTGVVRRLDGLAGQPVWETEYLVLFGRVWVRRELVLVGFVLWILMVWRGLPGSWRQRSPGGRRQAGRAYLPGFALRMVFLVVLFLVPVFAAVLLYPLALLTILGRGSDAVSRHLRCLLAALPTVAFALFVAGGQIAGWLVLEQAMALPAFLVLLTLATFCAWQLDDSAAGNGTSPPVSRPAAGP